MKTYHIKAFTKDPSLGNPAGVVVYKPGELSDSKMQDVAMEYAYSETAFIQLIDRNRFRIRFFSPKQEVDMCGHASIASAHVIYNEYLDKSINEIVLVANKKEVLVKVRQNKYYLNLGLAKLMEDEFENAQIASFLGINESEIIGEIKLVDIGSRKLIIPVKGFDTLKHIQPNLDDMVKYCSNSNVRGFYPFCKDNNDQNRFSARQFNPFAGINEDPVTGVAGGCLIKYLNDRDISVKKIIVSQGHFLDKLGKMSVEVDANGPILVGGNATEFEP